MKILNFRFQGWRARWKRTDSLTNWVCQMVKSADKNSHRENSKHLKVNIYLISSFCGNSFHFVGAYEFLWTSFLFSFSREKRKRFKKHLDVEQKPNICHHKFIARSCSEIKFFGLRKHGKEFSVAIRLFMIMSYDATRIVRWPTFITTYFFLGFKWQSLCNEAIYCDMIFLLSPSLILLPL